MSLADDLQTHYEQQTVAKQCGTGVWFASQSERDANAFAEFLARGGAVSHLHQLAVKNGCPIAETQFRRHCRKRCSCYRLENAA